MIETRIADQRDAPALTGLIEESCRHYFEIEPPDGVAQSWARRITERDGISAMIALRGDEALGFGTFVFLDSARSAAGTLFLKNLYVAAAARGTGAGHALMRALARHAVDLGCERFDWTAETDNPGAQAFYARLGAPRLAEKIYYRYDGDALTAFAKAAGRSCG